MCKYLQLADAIPTAFEESRVDIFIGNGYYLEIISLEKIEIQDGLHLLGSKLGWVITGKTKSSNEKKEEQMIKAN
jgi:hypothetical protein